HPRARLGARRTGGGARARRRRPVAALALGARALEGGDARAIDRGEGAFDARRRSAARADVAVLAAHGAPLPMGARARGEEGVVVRIGRGAPALERRAIAG